MGEHERVGGRQIKWEGIRDSQTINEVVVVKMK